MQKLSPRKEVAIIRLYLGGFSYSEIASRCGVSKGSVANVIADFKAGRTVDTQEPVEQLELLRELAVDLKRLRLTPGQAVAGVAVLSHLQALGIEAAEVERWAAMCRQLPPQETEAQAFVRAALALEEVRQRTGMSPEALEEKVKGLEEKVVHLEPLAQNVGACQRELEELEKRRQGLADEVSQLEKRQEALGQSVMQKEKREEELSHRSHELEERAQAADERLASARRDLKVLADLGLSIDDLRGFVQRLSGVAQRHAIGPKALRDRLLRELENLDKCLGLETLIEAKRQEFTQAQQATVKAQKERAGVESAIQELRGERAALHASIRDEEEYVRKQIQATARIAKGSVAELSGDLADGVGDVILQIQQVRDKALEVGREVGRLESVVESNQWLQTLMAIVNGNGGISAADVRMVALAVLRSTRDWMVQNQNQAARSPLLVTRLGEAVKELEQWVA